MRTHAQPTSPRAEPPSLRSLEDAARYFTVCELRRYLEAELEAEEEARGRPGHSRRGQFLALALRHAERLEGCLRPLAALE
jgi:hypothetical protein